MAFSSILVGDVLDILLEDDSDLSDKAIIEDDNEEYIYIWLSWWKNLLPSRINSFFPSEDEVMARTQRGL